MAILDVLIDPILPVFAILAFGFALGRTGRASVDDAKALNRFALTVFLPILIFGLVSKSPIEAFNPAPILVYWVSEVALFAVGFLLARRVFRRDAGEAALLAMAAVFVNHVFYVLPISVLIYGEQGAAPILKIVTVDATINFAAMMITLQMIRLGAAAPSEAAGALLRLPILWAIFLGLAANLLRLEIPAPVQTFIAFNGAAAAPVALFALGVVLSQTRFGAHPCVLSFSAMKLIALPAFVWIGLEMFAPGDADAALYVLCAAGPAGAMAFSIALLFDVKTEAIAQVIVYTSVLSLFSLAALA